MRESNETRGDQYDGTGQENEDNGTGSIQGMLLDVHKSRSGKLHSPSARAHDGRRGPTSKDAQEGTSDLQQAQDRDRHSSQHEQRRGRKRHSSHNRPEGLTFEEASHLLRILKEWHYFVDNIRSENLIAISQSFEHKKKRETNWDAVSLHYLRLNATFDAWRHYAFVRQKMHRMNELSKSINTRACIGKIGERWRDLAIHQNEAKAFDQAGSKPPVSNHQARPVTAPQVPRRSRPSRQTRSVHRRVSCECSQFGHPELSSEKDRGAADPRLLLEAQISLQRWMDLNSKSFVHVVTLPHMSKPSYSLNKRAALRLARIEKDLALSDLWFQDLVNSNETMNRPWTF